MLVFSGISPHSPLVPFKLMLESRKSRREDSYVFGGSWPCMTPRIPGIAWLALSRGVSESSLFL